jgi:hypothetical protein
MKTLILPNRNPVESSTGLKLFLQDRKIRLRKISGKHGERSELYEGESLTGVLSKDIVLGYGICLDSKTITGDVLVKIRPFGKKLFFIVNTGSIYVATLI